MLFSTAAYDGGQVFADLARADHPAGLAAIDAATGEIRWTRPNVAQQVFVGPAADDGVVVYTDSTGLVTALDATNGAELWHLRVDTPLAGTPVVTDGRVYLVEQGYQQDLNQRAARVTAYDARSGAFLGACERAADWGLKLHGRLMAEYTRLHRAARRERATSRMGDLVDVFVAEPAISARTAGQALGITPHAARALIGELRKKNLVQQLTDRGSFRLYGLP